MPRVSPTAEGFRLAARRPSFTLAEISWRWAAGATAVALFFFGLFEYLDTLPVTNGDALLLRTRHPYLVSQALAHIFRGTMPRAVVSAALAALLLTLLWIAAASLGRAVTVRSLLGYFRRDVACYVSAEGATPSEQVAADSGILSNVSTKRSSIPVLVRLNFLRAGVALAAAICLVGAAILAGFVSPDSDPHPGLAFLLFLLLAVIVLLTAGALNWFLSLAGMFAVRDSSTAVSALSAAASFCRDRTMAVFGVSLWTGLAHLVAFVAATMVVSVPLGLAGLLPGRIVVLCMVLVTLAYFVVVDWLYMVRLAGYVCIAETPEALLKPQPLPVPQMPQSLPVPQMPQPVPPVPLQTSIDKDEPILSDIPNSIEET